MPRPFTGETPYARAALERAGPAIEAAPNGAQEATLNKECFGIGGLISAGELEVETAIAALTEAALRMPAYAEPWADLERRSAARSRTGCASRGSIPRGPAVTIDDFVAYMQTHDYVFLPAGDFWPAARVAPACARSCSSTESLVPSTPKTGAQKQVSASRWLAKHAPVEQLTWIPGLPQMIRHQLTSAGGWVEHKNATVLNLYRPPRPSAGDPAKAGPWLDHVRRIYPDESDDIIRGSRTGSSAPTRRSTTGSGSAAPRALARTRLLEPVKHAVGPWNFVEVSPHHMLGRFNGFLKVRRAQNLRSEGHGRGRPLQIL